jgi:hypothetical protein
MEYKVGDRVECPPQGPHSGNRKGIIIKMRSCPANPSHLPALVKYTDYPTPSMAWVNPIKKIK